MINHLDLFSGIGGFRHAINLFGKDFNINVNCIGFSEIDNYALKTYKANYRPKNEVEIGDIVKFTSNISNIKKLPKFTLLTGGFPCQSFSMMGKKNGFSDVRGNAFFHIIDILKVKKPPFVLLENVRNIISHDKGNTLNTIISSLKHEGYPYVYYDIFNTEEFGLAQRRNRVYIFASRYLLMSDFEFNSKAILKYFIQLNTSSLLKQNTILDVLDRNVDEKYYLSEKVKPTILSDGSKNFKSKSEINRLIARPLTATMVKMHRACQDNYYSDNFIKSENPINYLKEHKFSKEELINQKIRKLTPQETFKLQGFDSSFVDRAKSVGVSNHQLYRQAGNAASVNTVYAILSYLFAYKDIISYIKE